MKRKILILAGILLSIAFLLTSCEYKKILPVDNKQIQVDYLAFGHTQGFCMNCDEIYKIEDGKLYGAVNQMISDPDEVSLTLLPASSYNLVSTLADHIPGQLFNESSSTIGSYFPDAGHYYVEVKRSGTIHHWYIEAGNTPGYLVNFLDELRNDLAKLR